MTLDPETYWCPIHGTDLTALVYKKVKYCTRLEKGIMMVGPALILARLFDKDQQKIKTKPFKVIVPCPSGDAPHRLTCAGTFTL